MDLFVEIQNSLNEIASGLFASTGRDATQAVHDAFEDLAFKYADDAGLAFGMHAVTDPASRNPDSAKRILVYRSGQRKWPTRDTQSQYLFDHCWLVYYNSKGPSDYVGRLASCDLVMESEFGFDSNESGKEYEFLKDFRKLVIVNSRVKVFVFRSRVEALRTKTFAKLRAEVESFGAESHPKGNYLLCGWCSNAFSYEIISE